MNRPVTPLRVGLRRPPSVDPDVDLDVPAQRRELAPTRGVAVLAAIAMGGILGAEARYGIGTALPHRPDQWPWATLLINLSGCLVIGVLMVALMEFTRPHPLVRPLLGVGALGGYTTFAAYGVDTLSLLQAGRPVVALGYFLLTPLVTLVAVSAGSALTRAVGARFTRRAPGAGDLQAPTRAGRG